MWRTNPLQTSIYLFWVNFCKWNTLVPNCLHRRMCMLVSGLKIKLFFPLIMLIIVSKILLCRLLGIYVYNANHFDADGNYSQVYYETTVLEFMTRIIFNFFLVCDNLLGDFCYLHCLNHAKAWQPPFLNLLIAQWANVWRQMYRSTHDLEMLELLWFMSIVHCLIQLPTSRRSLHIFCSGRSWWKPKAPMINDGKFIKRNKYVICTSFW